MFYYPIQRFPYPLTPHDKLFGIKFSIAGGVSHPHNASETYIIQNIHHKPYKLTSTDPSQQEFSGDEFLPASFRSDRGALRQIVLSERSFGRFSPS